MVARARAGGNCSLCSARAVSQAGRTSGKRPCSSHGQNQNHGQQQPRKAAANRWPQTKTKSGGSSLCKSSPRKSARLRFAAPPSPAGAARWLLPVVRSAPAPHFALRAAAAPSPRPAAARKISRVAAAGLRWRARRAAWSARASFCSHRVRRALPRQKHALRAPEKGTRSARRKKARAPRAGKRHALRAPEKGTRSARRKRHCRRRDVLGQFRGHRNSVSSKLRRVGRCPKGHDQKKSPRWVGRFFLVAQEGVSRGLALAHRGHEPAGRQEQRAEF